VDGNTDGDYKDGSVTFAKGGAYPWWQVDLAVTPTIQAVQLWNRTDGRDLHVPEQLRAFYVFVSEEAFGGQDTPADIKGREGVWWYYHAGTVDEEYGGVEMRLQTISWNDFRDDQGRPPEEFRELTGRYVRVQLDGADRDPLSLAEVQVWGIPAEVEQWPAFAPQADKKGDSFKLTFRDDSHQTVDGKIAWGWNVAREGDVKVWDLGSGSFDTTKVKEGDEITESSSAEGFRVGFGIQGFEAEGMSGGRRATSRKLTWSEETQFSGTSGTLESSEHEYTYAPYIWLQEATSSQGVEHAFLVLDYWVLNIRPSAAGQGAAPQVTAPGPVPMAPLIDSPSHADPAVWYHSNTATFTWAQPAGDPAKVTGYRWYLDREPDTVPVAINLGPATSHTYSNLRDGVWYLHVRARGEGGVWGETAHRAIRVDANAPRVRLALDPPLPTGNGGWYNTPLNVTITAGDDTGSSVAGVEFSTDGTHWQPYGGALTFDGGTVGTTIWGRAADVAGHVSEPVSATFMIDLWPPDSELTSAPHPGAWRAEVIVDPLGNEQLVLAGIIEDDYAGPAGLDLTAADTTWTASSRALTTPVAVPGLPGVEANWHYSATVELGRGNHTFHGAAHDQAGNLEEVYELARVVWFPQATPSLAGSGMAARPAEVRPGDDVSFRIAVRNGGYQEAWVQVVDSLPQGLAPVTGLLAGDVQYDPGTGTLTWPARLLWPGEWHWFQFRARVDGGLGATTLENRATARAFWPNTGELPAADRQRFEEREQTVDLAATVRVVPTHVDPGLGAGADNNAPWASLSVQSGQALLDPEVELGIAAAEDARWMYLREWTLDPASGEWAVAQNSGWRPYTPATTWTLTPGAGVKYLGVWVADDAWNVSTLDEYSLAFTNLLAEQDLLPDGQRRQYRFELAAGSLAIYNLLAHRGDPDLYVWEPRHAFRPNHAAENTQLVDALGLRPQEQGIHLLEVMSRGESEYDLWLARPDTVEALASVATLPGSKARPEHPLTVSDPLSAGVGTRAPGLTLYRYYIPVAFKDG
jgi:uncharacterized repeat protein (TIGR01451 family)